jgi:hypothetical protein
VFTVPDRLRLGLAFDPAPLADEIAALPRHAWVPHFNLAVHDGEWAGITLRGPEGDATRIYPDPTNALPVLDTPVLTACPAAAAVVGAFACPVLIARFLALGPGATIRPHHDDGLGFSDGTVRLHIPVVTAPGVTLDVDGRPVVMAPGECWYIDFRSTHAAANRSAVRRVHLVIDCAVDPWLTEVFVRALT